MTKMDTKTYPDGSTGNYYCICSICNSQFIGHKRDMYCGKHGCVEEKTEPSIKKEFTHLSNWKELNGKQLHVIVVEDGGFQSVNLYEANTQKIYVVAVDKLEEK